MTTSAPKVHPIAQLFPPLSEAELAELTADIKQHGLQQAIVMQGGILLDGRNRLQGCKLAGVEPRFTEYQGDNPAAFIVSANIRRRHLNESQRSMVAAGLANMGHGGDRRSDQAANLPLVSQADAASLLNVSARSVRDAKLIKTEAPDLADKVLAGEITLNRAKKEYKARKAERIRPVASAFNVGESTIVDAEFEPKSETTALAETGAIVGPRQRQRTEAHKSRMIIAISQCKGYCMGLPKLNTAWIRGALTADDLRGWLGDIKGIRKDLATFAGRLAQPPEERP